MKFEPSITETNGIKLLDSNMLKIISIGISTVGSFEIEMASKCPKAKIIATTIDEKGLALTKEIIGKTEFRDRIVCKIEDCGKEWLYSDNTFDFIYARLVLHYLDKDKFQTALKEMFRTLKVGHRAFIVVRSVDEYELKNQELSYDEKTGFTHYIDFTNSPKARQFFSEESLHTNLENNGFKVEYVREIHEHLFEDYERTVKNPNCNTLLEAVVTKKERS